MVFYIVYLILMLINFIQGYGLMYTLITFIGLSLFSELLAIRRILEKNNNENITIMDIKKVLSKK